MPSYEYTEYEMSDKDYAQISVLLGRVTGWPRHLTAWTIIAARTDTVPLPGEENIRVYCNTSEGPQVVALLSLALCGLTARDLER